ncbi:hypothetical protein ACF1BQ_030530 [Bradyrhizobium sp. RDT10]
MVAKIAAGEIEEGGEPESKAAATLGRRGGKARAASLTPKQRSEIARVAAEARWKKPPRVVCIPASTTIAGKAGAMLRESLDLVGITSVRVHE